MTSHLSFFFSSRRRHTRSTRDWSSDVCSSDLGTQRLPRFVGPGPARLMIFSGEPISGRRAAEWGLVEEAVGPAEVFDRAAGIARTLAAQSPHALAVIKALLRETDDARLRDGLRTETAAFARLLAHPDAREGIAAFLEKRQPRWAAQPGGHPDA